MARVTTKPEMHKAEICQMEINGIVTPVLKLDGFKIKGIAGLEYETSGDGVMGFITVRVLVQSVNEHSNKAEGYGSAVENPLGEG